MKRLRYVFLSAALIALSTEFSAFAQPTDSAGSISQSNTNREFFFKGGTAEDFVIAIEKYFKVDWLTVLDRSPELTSVRIPKLRLSPITGNTDADLGDLVNAYNGLAHQKPELGRLLITGSASRPAYVSFARSKSENRDLQVKAFGLSKFPKAEWDKLVREIVITQTQAVETFRNMEAQDSAAAMSQGVVRIHEDGTLLVAIGSEIYIKMVESFLPAYNTLPPNQMKLSAPTDGPSPAPSTK